MIRTLTLHSAAVPLSLPTCRDLLRTAATAGFDALFFVRGPGPVLDAVPLIAALASVPAWIGLGASVPIDYQEPFHLARAYAAIDRLTAGRSAVVLDGGDGLAAAIGRDVDLCAERRVECLTAARTLWDSWEDEAVLVDRPAGLFTDPARIHRVDHAGRYFTVRGPLNAPRPLQGWPVVVAPLAMGQTALAADVVTVTTAAEVVSVAGRVGRVLLDVAVGTAEPALPDGCDGVNFVARSQTGLADWLGGLDRRRDAGPATLRQRLGLRRPVSQFAGA
jgi:alkanesulfonate monooxygenase SsuD/methylene tetrahydromethanopterin reductase-like flavin-dependent oxidoreductase (luciferase family)